MDAFSHVITSEQDLRAIVGNPAPRSVLKQRPVLDEHCRAFIAHSPFVLMATANADGRCDVSPKGDAPGFVLVLDERRLVVPERPGNRRTDSMQNVLVNPHVGILFVVPGREETLRVNGRASITRDPELLARCVASGKTPLLAIGVEVEETFFHCAKSFLRAQLWAPEHWPPPDALPSYACMVFDQIKPEGLTVQDYERDIEASYKQLY
jgi:PPOX class probable FMN-dependent enzyme